MDGHSLPFCPCPPLLSSRLLNPGPTSASKYNQNAPKRTNSSLLLRFLLIFSTPLSPFDPTTLTLHTPSPPFPGARRPLPPGPPWNRRSQHSKAAPRFLRRCCAFNAFVPVALYLTICPGFFLLLLILFTAGGATVKWIWRAKKAATSAVRWHQRRSIDQSMTQLIDVSMEAK